MSNFNTDTSIDLDDVVKSALLCAFSEKLDDKKVYVNFTNVFNLARQEKLDEIGDKSLNDKIVDMNNKNWNLIVFITLGIFKSVNS